MGVDKDDVDLVVHFNLPLSLTDYYQQAGRAGRSGQAARCILLYCENDYFVNQCLLESIEDRQAKKVAKKALDQMKEYPANQELAKMVATFIKNPHGCGFVSPENMNQLKKARKKDLYSQARSKAGEPAAAENPAGD